MEVSELKHRILSNDIPRNLVFIDNCHILTAEYIKALSKQLNRRPIHVYSIQDALELNSRFDRRDLMGVVHGCVKQAHELRNIQEVYYVFIEETSDNVLNDLIDCVKFPALNKNQCILYIEDWLISNGFFNKVEGKQVLTLSRTNIEKLIDYFENDLDLIMNELQKFKCLEVHALDRPFNAIFECLPDKQKKLKSLPWYSGGAVDTAQVLYATYKKKLKAADQSIPIEKQLWYTQLITEAIFAEIEILAGKFGDYALDYFKLIEKMSPDEFKIQWFPPVSREEIGPEWMLKTDEESV